MKKLPIFTIPFASTSSTAFLVDDDRGLSLSIARDEAARDLTVILFHKPRAYRTRQEVHCTPWHVNEVYDNLCEVTDSDWVDELRGDTVPDWRDRWVMRHFMIYLDSFGSLEVVADSVLFEGTSVEHDV
jgi:hypothetical protein